MTLAFRVIDEGETKLSVFFCILSAKIIHCSLLFAYPHILPRKDRIMIVCMLLQVECECALSCLIDFTNFGNSYMQNLQRICTACRNI